MCISALRGPSSFAGVVWGIAYEMHIWKCWETCMEYAVQRQLWSRKQKNTTKTDEEQKLQLNNAGVLVACTFGEMW